MNGHLNTWLLMRCERCLDKTARADALLARLARCEVCGHAPHDGVCPVDADDDPAEVCGCRRAA